MKKICFVASSGGHLAEILQLRAVGQNYESVLLTEKTAFGLNHWMDRVYLVPQVNRHEIVCGFKLMKNVVVSFGMLRKERPDIVIATGALAAIPVCLLARMMGIRVIYIESFARVHSPSQTGKLMYRVADKTVVQWPELLKYFPNAVFGGAIY